VAERRKSLRTGLYASWPKTLFVVEYLGVIVSHFHVIIVTKDAGLVLFVNRKFRKYMN